VKADICQLFPNSTFVHTCNQAIARQLDLTVTGKLDDAAIIMKASEIAKD